MLDHAPVQPADQALLSVADQLTAAGFDTRSPAWDDAAYLKITNAPRIAQRTHHHRMRPRDLGMPALPAHLCPARNARRHRPRPARPSRPLPSTSVTPADLTPLSLAGRALADHGLSVTLDVHDFDQTTYDTYSELRIANRARPERGTANLACDCTIWWRCRIHHAAT